MEDQWASVTPGLFTTLVTLLLLLVAVTTKSRTRLPPGPTSWPVVGSILLLGTLPHQSLAKLAKKYGPLMFMKLGSRDVIVVSCPKIAQEILKTQDKVWASRPPATAAVKIMAYEGMEMAFAELGPRWRYARKLFTLELFTPKRLLDFQESRKQEISRCVRETIDGCCNGTRAINMSLVVGKIATNVIIRMLMNGSTLSEEANALRNTDDFQERVKYVFRLAGAFYLGDYVPWLDRFDPQGMKKEMYATAKVYDAFLQRILDDHKMKHQTQGPPDEKAQDLVDALLTRPRDADGTCLTDEEMKAIIGDVIFGGTDTNSATLEWGLTELLKSPRILERAQAELDSMVGRDRLVEESDLRNLPYLNAFMKELLRLHPAGPLMIPHMSTEDTEIHGYRIPAGTRCIINVYAIQRDPALYERAEEFYPERFLGSTKDVHGLDFDLVPFGSGRRMCPGKGLALLVVSYSLALFIQTCNWTLPGNMKPQDLDMEEKFGLTIPRLNPLLAIAAPRLDEQLLRDFLN